MLERVDRLKSALYNVLRNTAAGYPVAVAYSGGLDSRFLLHAALGAGLSIHAFHVRGPHVPVCERRYALKWAEENNVPLTVVDFDPLEDPLLRGNPADRCYICKRAVFTAIRNAARDELGEGTILCDGTNVSDFSEHRPGHKALRELGVRSPLAEAGLGKDDIRFLGARTGFENPDQAAQPCLLTRFGYGSRLSPERLLLVDKGEEAVRHVLSARGLANALFRLRYEDADTPALHTAFEPDAGMRKDIDEALARSGFPGIPVRTLAQLSGFFDAGLYKTENPGYLVQL